MMNQMKTVFLIAVLSAIVLSLGAAIAPGHLYLFAALALAMNLGAWFFSDRLVLRMHGARELEPARAPDIHAMTEELAAAAGIPKPRIYLLPGAQPNAFATGRNPRHGAVAVTEGIVALLSRRELRAVIAHEIAHIRNRDILLASIAAALTSLVTYAAHALSFAGIFGGRGGGGDGEGQGAGGGLLLALLAPIGATLVQLGISRSREYLADETGARLCGDPEALASALRKLEQGAALLPPEAPEPATASLFIVNPLAGAGSMLRLFSTHPPTEERVRRLLAMRTSTGAGLLHAG